MKIFFLDIASKNGTLACVTDDAVLAVKTIDTKISDAELPALMREVWAEAGWSEKDISHLACAVGPGGFMSLRVGVASVNALAWGLGIPSCGMKLWELYEARAGNAVWVHSTKKSEVFLRMDAETMHVTLDEALARIPQQSQWIGELIPEHMELFSNAGHEPAKVGSLEEVLPAFLASQTYERQTLVPWYGREG